MEDDRQMTSVTTAEIEDEVKSVLRSRGLHGPPIVTLVDACEWEIRLSLNTGVITVSFAPEYYEKWRDAQPRLRQAITEGINGDSNV
jgi:hypothetical protein